MSNFKHNRGTIVKVKDSQFEDFTVLEEVTEEEIKQGATVYRLRDRLEWLYTELSDFEFMENTDMVSYTSCEIELIETELANKGGVK